jgi:hypothetical protein
MGVLDDFLVDPSISMLDKTKIQAQVLVMQALRDWSRQVFAGIAEGIEGSPRRKFAAMNTALADVTEREVTFDMHRRDKQALEFDIRSCRFAEFFRALGEPELGALLVCQTDIDIAEAGGSEVSFSRTQTLMQGASCCNFRYKFESR